MKTLKIKGDDRILEQFEDKINEMMGDVGRLQSSFQ